MDKYSFFTRKCIWYDVDDTVESSRAFIQNTFNLNNELGEELKGMTGGEIILYINNKIKHSETDICDTRIDKYKRLRDEGFLDVCSKNMDFYLYTTNMKIVTHNGE